MASGAATILIVLSPSYLVSVWCQKELNWFFQKRSTSKGIVFVVEAEHVERHSRPRQLQDIEGYHFFVKERDRLDDTRRLGLPSLSRATPDDQHLYDNELNRLVNDLTRELKRLRSNQLAADSVRRSAIRERRAVSSQGAMCRPYVAHIKEARNGAGGRRYRGSLPRRRGGDTRIKQSPPTSMTGVVAVYNPSHYWRGGYVTVPWQAVGQLGIRPDRCMLSGLNGMPIEFQVDEVLPDDPSRDSLLFHLPQPICPGPDDYSRRSALLALQWNKGNSNFADRAWVDLEKHDGTACNDRDEKPAVVKLRNASLVVRINLAATGASEDRDRYGGCATSVRVPYRDRDKELELLDVFRDVGGFSEPPDTEKRCLHVDQLQLVDETRGTRSAKIDLSGRSYELVQWRNGPLRAFVTIVLPFEAEIRGYRKRYQLQRVISLFAGGEYLLEELSLQDTAEPVGAQHFTVRYFSHMDMGSGADEDVTYRFVPRWFALGARGWPPYPGYGFAADSDIEDVRRDESPRPDAHKRFWWELCPTATLSCLHLFMLGRENMIPGEPDCFDARVGRVWYEGIHKKLRAEVV
jgi:hypothetical protein